MVNLDDFKYGGTNLTAFRLLDPEREEVKQVVQDWIFGELRYGRKLEAHEQTIKVEFSQIIFILKIFFLFLALINVMCHNLNVMFKKDIS